jgi:hypothetical protein
MIQVTEEHHVGVPIEVVGNTIGLSHLCEASERSQEHLEAGNHLGCAFRIPWNWKKWEQNVLEKNWQNRIVT